MSMEEPTYPRNVPSKPILHPEFLPGVEVIDVDFQAAIEVLTMNAFSPAVSQLLCHTATGEGQPWSIEPNAKFVSAGHPNHHRRRVHHLTEPRVQATRGLARKLGGCG